MLRGTFSCLGWVLGHERAGEAGLAVAGVFMVSGWYVGVVGLVAPFLDMDGLLALFGRILVFPRAPRSCVSLRRLWTNFLVILREVAVGP